MTDLTPHIVLAFGKYLARATADCGGHKTFGTGEPIYILRDGVPHLTKFLSMLDSSTCWEMESALEEYFPGEIYQKSREKKTVSLMVAPSCRATTACL